MADQLKNGTMWLSLTYSIPLLTNTKVFFPIMLPHCAQVVCLSISFLYLYILILMAFLTLLTPFASSSPTSIPESLSFQTFNKSNDLKHPATDKSCLYFFNGIGSRLLPILLIRSSLVFYENWAVCRGLIV